jgi:hypothetical protein
MSAFDAVAYVLGEGAVYMTGKVIGRAFKIERERALHIGQYIVIGAIAVGGLALCVIYT